MKAWMVLLVALFAFPAMAESPALSHLNQLLSGNAAEGLLDDPANAAIYEKLDAVVRSLERGLDNQGDRLSYLTVEDGVLGDLTDLEQRVRELLVQKASGLLTSSDRQNLDAELSGLQADAVDVLRQAEFNTIKLFAGFLDDPELVSLVSDPDRLSLDGVDSLLDFLNRQRAAVGAQMNGQEREHQGGQLTVQNALVMRDQIGLLARLLMLRGLR